MTTSTADTGETTATHLAEGWVAFWNGALDRAESLLTTNFRVHFGGGEATDLAGDPVLGPDQMAAFIGHARAAKEGLVFALDAAPIGDDDVFAIRWSVSAPDVDASGIDILRVSGDRIAEVWSLTGGRRFPA